MKKRKQKSVNEEFNIVKKELYDIYGMIMSCDKISNETYELFTNKLNDISEYLLLYDIENDEIIEESFDEMRKNSIRAIIHLLTGVAGTILLPKLFEVFVIYMVISACVGICSIALNVIDIEYHKNNSQNEFKKIEIAKLENTISNCRVFLKRKSASCEHSDTKEIDVADTFIRVNEKLVTFGKDLDTSKLSEEEINILILILQENLGTSETDLNKLLEVYNNKVLSENLEKGIGLKRVLLENDDKGM